MIPVVINDFPSLKEFMTFSKDEVKNFTIKNKIETCYLPVDGTRRFYLVYSKLFNRWDEKDLKNYFNEVNNRFRDVFSLFFDYGIKNLILLLMDKSAFSRGSKYLNEVLESGIKPLYSDERYLSMYRKYNLDVIFGGFTSLFEKYYNYDILNGLEMNFKGLSKESENKFLIYNGLSPSEDYLLVGEIINSLRKRNISVCKKSLIKEIYKTELSSIDLSIWYGYPRDKIVPPLLWDDGTNFFIKNPTLTLQPVQLKKALYYTAVTKNSIKDSYHSYSFVPNEKEDLMDSFDNEDSLFGQDYYYVR